MERGRQPGTKSCCKEWTTRCAVFCVREPRWSAGRSLVQGSIASHTRSTCFELRSRVRSSSRCRFGRWRRRKERSCKSCACSPARVRKAGDGGLSKAEDPLGGGRIEPFGQRREHYGDLVRRDFQTVQGGVTSGGERGASGLTTKGLDVLDTAMRAISDQGMSVSSGDAEVRALLVCTGETLCVHPLGGSSPAFDLAPGPHRQRRWTRTRRCIGGVTAGGAIVWAAGFEQTVEPGAYLGCSSRLGRTRMEPAKRTKQE